MGLDLGIVRKRKGAAYEACAEEDVCWWRNCWAARDIILASISTYDKEKCEASLTIGAIQMMLENLIKEASRYNLDKPYEQDGLAKIYLCISDLAKILHDDLWDREFEEPIEYDYILIDSY